MDSNPPTITIGKCAGCKSLEKRVEKLEVQLAGCDIAALGYIDEPIKKGDYGWSPSYQDVLHLRMKYNRLKTRLEPNIIRTMKELMDNAEIDRLEAEIDRLKESVKVRGEYIIRQHKQIAEYPELMIENEKNKAENDRLKVELGKRWR